MAGTDLNPMASSGRRSMNILLTGPPRVGKTTAILRIVQDLGSGMCGGFWSEEIREQGRRVGFRVTTLEGEKGILAHVALRTGPRVGKYRVNVSDIDSVAVPAMERARRSGRIIVIDEIARMELYSSKFADEVLRCLDTGRVVGTIQQKRMPFLEQVRSRPDVVLLEMNLSNRDAVPKRVLELLQC